MGCDAVVMEKVIRVATTAILSIELTAAFSLWLMASLGKGGRWGGVDCKICVAYISHFNMIVGYLMQG